MTVCPVEAILVGDINDPASEVSRVISGEPVQVRRPEKDTRPGVYCKGAHAATLDPLAARRPGGGLFAWATQDRPGPQSVTSGHPGRGTSQAAALLSYDVPHQAPWGWRVSLYTWTKSVAAGAFAVPVLLAGTGYLSWGNDVVRWAAPVLALAFLAATGALLVADLKHPDRFYLLFTRHHWRSWLVRGAVLLGGFGAVTAAYLLASLTGASAGPALQVFGWIGLPLALAAAIYTAYLFAQAKGRDLWQSPLLAPHLAVQAGLAGSAVALPLLTWLAPGRAVTADKIVLAILAAVHLALVASEVTLPHVTAHARLAAHELTRGRYAAPFWISVFLIAAAIPAPWTGTSATALALLGLLAYEHAYVQAGQCVPLA